MIKRIAALVLAIAILFAFAACRDGKMSSKEKSFPASEEQDTANPEEFENGDNPDYVQTSACAEGSVPVAYFSWPENTKQFAESVHT